MSLYGSFEYYLSLPFVWSWNDWLVDTGAGKYFCLCFNLSHFTNEQTYDFFIPVWFLWDPSPPQQSMHNSWKRGPPPGYMIPTPSLALGPNPGPRLSISVNASPRHSSWCITQHSTPPHSMVLTIEPAPFLSSCSSFDSRVKIIIWAAFQVIFFLVWPGPEDLIYWPVGNILRSNFDLDDENNSLFSFFYILISSTRLYIFWNKNYSFLYSSPH